jgi:hypothetical protein
VCGTLPNLFANWNGWICLVSIATMLVIIWDIFWGHLNDKKEKEKEINNNNNTESYDNEEMNYDEEEQDTRKRKKAYRAESSNKRLARKSIARDLRK